MTAQEVRAKLNYDPISGIFIWKVRPHRCRLMAGSAAGSILKSKTSFGYRRISINDKSYLAHRLAWLYTYGEWPSRHIDHINGNRDDNSIKNLRLANDSENGRNRKVGVNNKSGAIGVRWNRGAFEAYITHLNYSYYLGRFKTIEKAKAVRQAKALELFGEFLGGSHE